MQVVENSFKKAYGGKLIYWKVHIGIDSMRQFQCVPTTYVTENKEENYLEIYIFQVSGPLSLPLLNTPNYQSVLKCPSLYCKLFTFAWQLYLQMWVLELHIF